MGDTWRDRSDSLSEPLCPHGANCEDSRQGIFSEAALSSTPKEAREDNNVCSLCLHVSQCGQPPKRLVAELQIETLSTACVRAFLYSWYAMLLLALILQSFVSLQWEMVNFCGATPESLRRLDTWRSPCVQNFTPLSKDLNLSKYTGNGGSFFMSRDKLKNFAFGIESESTGLVVVKGTPLPDRRYDIRWVSSGYKFILNVKLNRFARVVLSMASPQNDLPEGVQWKRYQLKVALDDSLLSLDDVNVSTFSEGGSSSKGQVVRQKSVFLYNTSTVCYRSSPRCDSVVLPLNVAVVVNRSQITLTILGIDEEIGNLAAASAVGIAFQRSEYTIGTIVLRYTFLLLSVLHLVRFVYRKRYSKTLNEQYWVIFLHIGLYLYLDPLFAAGIYEYCGRTVYYFFEFRFPTYFAAFLSCFIFALITISLDWTSKSGKTDNLEIVQIGDETQRKKVGLSPFLGSSKNPKFVSLIGSEPPTAVLPGDQQHEEHSDHHHYHYHHDLDFCDNEVRPIYAVRGGMPLAAKMTMITFLLAIFSLEIAQAYIEEWDWKGDVLCADFPCFYIHYTLYSLLLLSILVCCGLLVKLKHNLGERPYLATRPQQLACRVFIFVFTTALMYFVLQVILIAVLYPQIVGIVAYQPFTLLSPVIVSTFFVNYITFIYTTTVASRRVPIRPENPLWRHVVWSSEWYRWLDLHGGILYIFHSEQQERYFNWLQKKGHTPVKRHQKPSIHAIGTECDATATKPFYQKEENIVSNALESGRKIRGQATYDSYSFYGSLGDLTDEFGEIGEEVCPGLYDDCDGNGLNFINTVEAVHSSRRPSTHRMSLGPQQAKPHLFSTPATFIDRLEGVFVDPLQYLFLRRSNRLYFFNLETAIDCLNLSWEAYVKVRQTNAEEYANKPEASSGIHAETLGCKEDCSALCSCSVDINDGNDDNKDNKEADNKTISDTRSKDCVVSEDGGHSEAPREERPLPMSKICTEQYGYKQLAVFEGRNVQVVIAVMDTTLSCHHHKLPRLVVAFRGTDNLSNAREDLRFRKRKWREVNTLRQWGIGQRAKVHTGFLNIWISLKEAVLGTLRSYLSAHPDEVYRVFCTGHSLGGAIASLCAYSVYKMLCLIKYPLSEVTVYTFGQPPLGNKAFQSTYNKAVPRTFRVVNESDAVSFLSLFGGCYVGIEVDIDRYGNYICKPMFIERLFRPTKGRGFSVINHTLSAYALSLNAVATRDSEGACRARCLQPYVSNEELERDNAPSLPA